MFKLFFFVCLRMKRFWRRKEKEEEKEEKKMEKQEEKKEKEEENIQTIFFCLFDNEVIFEKEL